LAHFRQKKGETEFFGVKDMIDIQTEHLISLKDACNLIPGRAGKSISRATIWRWALAGRRGVRLETVLLGDRLTSVEAIARFVAALNGLTHDTKPTDRGHHAAMVEKQLVAEGF
jgi:hypothetical protein